MKFATYVLAGGSPQAGVLLGGDSVLNLAAAGQSCGMDLPGNLLELLDQGENGLERASHAANRAQQVGVPTVPLSDVHLLAPLPRPRHVFALAGNYVGHIEESGMIANEKARTTMRPFVKPSNSIIGPTDPIRQPELSKQIDYEVELAVVIGRQASRISADEAAGYIAGYGVFNDISARSLTIADERDPREGDHFYDWLIGKWFDTFSVFGPVITTADEIGDPHQLRVSLKVNSDLRQDGSTGQMIFNSYEVISFLSQVTTLEPGTIIATGTPAGVGAASQTYLTQGDIVEASIEGLGMLRNMVISS